MDKLSDKTETHTQTDKQMPVLDIQQITKSYEAIYEALNNATTKGLFTLDEAFMLKLHSNNIIRTIDVLDKYQKLVTELANKGEDKHIDL